MDSQDKAEKTLAEINTLLANLQHRQYSPKKESLMDTTSSG
jgi:hypothetical protein